MTEPTPNAPPAAVVFLDMDGVIVTDRSCITDTGICGAPDPVAVHMVRTLCEDLSAKVVLSSSWRTIFEPQAMLHILKGMGFEERHLYMADWPAGFYTPYRPNGFRGMEIAAWLNTHPDVRHYVILDDGSDMCVWQQPHFVRTDSSDGMRYEDYRAAREALRRERV